jgi:uncharacterized membrane protein (TIGR02234 family)
VCTLIAAVLLMRAASIAGPGREGATKYASRGARRSTARDDDGTAGPQMSERMIWDALDEGRDPTDRPRESDTEGR